MALSEALIEACPHGNRKSNRVCIVTSTHISYNPRALKEADTLSDAGYDVRVVGLNHEDAKLAWDKRLAASRRWRNEAVDARRNHPGGMARCVFSKLRSGWYERMRDYGLSGWALELAYSRYFPELRALAQREPADLFIAHNLPALPAAAAAAARWSAKLGFDAEDFHRGEFLHSATTATLIHQTAAIEEKYIRRCDYITAASDGIALAYADSLGVAMPTNILNVFPLSSRHVEIDPRELACERRGAGLSLYWYSQVIGPGRGLEVAVRALALLEGRYSLALRGEWADGYRDSLMGLARNLGVTHLVHELGVVAPDELVRRASLHDVGLASELPETSNRRIAVTNKLLVYLLAGIPVAASDVPSQVRLMENVAGAGFLYGAQDPQGLAAGLLALAASPESLESAKATARRHGESRYCWEIESRRLLDLIDGVLLGAP